MESPGRHNPASSPTSNESLGHWLGQSLTLTLILQFTSNGSQSLSRADLFIINPIFYKKPESSFPRLVLLDSRRRSEWRTPWATSVVLRAAWVSVKLLICGHNRQERGVGKKSMIPVFPLLLSVCAALVAAAFPVTQISLGKTFTLLTAITYI